MIRLVLVFLILVAPPAQAGFKMFGPNGYMNSSETDEERSARELQDEQNRKIAEQAEATTPRRPPTHRKTGENPLSMEDVERGKPPVIDDGPRPGGHRRHLWREQTGFNTPAERTRYRMEIQRLNRELKKERAKPNPAGDHPKKIRKSLGIKL